MRGIEKKEVKFKGFTLVELIMSIGIIAIISGVVLQLFITAGNMNKRAADLDKSVMISETLVEKFKSSTGPLDFSQSEGMKQSLENNKAKQYNLKLYYDNDWNVIKTTSDKENLNKSAAFILKINLSSSNEAQLWKMKIDVIKNQFRYLEKNNGKAFYSIEAAKCFSNVKVD